MTSLMDDRLSNDDFRLNFPLLLMSEEQNELEIPRNERESITFYCYCIFFISSFFIFTI